MNIIHYIPTYAPAWRFGGPVLSVSQLCEALVAQGHTVEVLTTMAGIEDGQGLVPGRPTERNGVAVTYFPVVPGMGINSPDMEAAIALQAGKADLIHVTGVWQRVSPAARRAALAAGVPYVVSPRGALGVYSFGQKRLKKRLYYLLAERANMRAAAGVHYTSEMERRECARFAFPGLETVIANGIDTALWRRDEAAGRAWRERMDIGPRTFVMLCAGRLHHKKGLDLLPEALAGLGEKDFRMVFVGGDDDGTKAGLAAGFAERGLIERVVFCDRVAPGDLPAIYSSADVFVLPSRHENFGNSVLEAMACGCPALVSDAVGFGDEAAASGLGSVMPRDPSLWTEKLADLMRHPMPAADRLARMDTLRTRFDITSTAKDMAAFYRHVADAGLGRP